MRNTSRRTFLKGVTLGAAAPLLQPMFSDMAAQAAGTATKVRRFVVFVNGNGLHEERYKLTTRSETDFDLGPIFAPLAPWKSDLLFLQKFYNPHNRDLHGNGWATLAVQPSASTGCQAKDDCVNRLYGRASGVSLDRFVASKIGSDTPFSSTNLCMASNDDGSGQHVSADGADNPYPGETSPVRAFANLFGKVTAGSTDASRRTLARKSSVLDFVVTDLKRAEGDLAGPERVKLDQYLTSLRDLETQLQRLAQTELSCTVPTAPAQRLDKLQTSLSAVQPDVIKAHVDITFNALACGLTRVGAISLWGGGSNNNGYEFLGGYYNHHTNCHDMANDKIARIDNYVCSQVAYLVDRLHSVPEGDGTMADQSLVMWINSGGGIHHNGQDNHAIILVGNPGKYFRSGRYVSYPSKSNCVSDVFVSVANSLGVNVATFGDPKVCKGALPGLV